jgi:pimeloyl-ACP methyl ester carboxylesterase
VAVLLTGTDRTGDEWTGIRTMPNHNSRVVTFEPGCRASAALSGPDHPVTRMDAADLEELLERAAIDPPYVLLAHPSAERYACDFADRNPIKVARLVVLQTLDEPSTIPLPSGARHPAGALPVPERACVHRSTHGGDQQVLLEHETRDSHDGYN